MAARSRSRSFEKWNHRLLVFLAWTFLVSIFVAVVPVSGERPFAICDEDPTCTKTECNLPDPCEGIVMPKFSYPCGCCDVCVQYLKEGDTCKSRLQRPDDKICGPGLTCSPDTKKCAKFQTKCALMQAAFDNETETNGQIGVNSYRPDCDDLGKFSGRQCVDGSVCYCVTEDGDRIEGEALGSNAEGMDCQCSRDVLKIKAQYASKLNEDSELPLCLTNGNYSPLQCSSGTCYCIGNSTDPWPDTAPISEDFADLLPCYDPQAHQQLPRNKACVKEYREFMENMHMDQPVIPGRSPPECAIDGGYKAVQFKLENKICVDPRGQLIEEFIVDAASKAGEEMNCYCARARYWALTGLGYMPTCCPNGNYVPWQCNGPTCNCVSLETGQPYGDTVDESDKDKLPCFSTHPCHEE